MRCDKHKSIRSQHRNETKCQAGPLKVTLLYLLDYGPEITGKPEGQPEYQDDPRQSQLSHDLPQPAFGSSADNIRTAAEVLRPLTSSSSARAPWPVLRQNVIERLRCHQRSPVGGICSHSRAAVVIRIDVVPYRFRSEGHISCHGYADDDRQQKRSS